ncbi:MAG: L-rhamnose mutarotase [Acidobacteriota bacterium]|jgi:cytidyltransferase-like protein
MTDPKTQHIGSLLRLRPEYEERYIVLHKHIFPGVLRSISRSNIRNYSIFLRDGILFSHLEYIGDDYDADMAAIADETTREWWKLTDPMQEPLETRKEGEWWAIMEMLGHKEGGEQPGRQALRLAGCRNEESCRNSQDSVIAGLMGHAFRAVSSYRHDKTVCLYAEYAGEIDAWPRVEEEFLRFSRQAGFQEMKEVFHTDGLPGKKKVIVTGCFDLLHSGHLAFLKEAAGYGDLYVCIGNDENVSSLKGRYPINSQEERHFMLSSLACVKECRINSGTGIIDFLKEMDDIGPDIFIVNEDGNTPTKVELCRHKGIEYIVLKRIPYGNLPIRSTTALKTECRIPFRIDLAGGWLDQPFVSKYYPGPVITISIEPTFEFNDRSGMASSTRRKAIELWKSDVPHGDREQLAKILFAYENPPGTNEVSGAQDALGIVFPGLNKHNYSGDYWPYSIESVDDPVILDWLESSLYLITLGPRVSGFHVLENTNITAEGARALAEATDACWTAILSKNIVEFGKQFRRSFEAQIAMFPNMVDESILNIIGEYENRAHGWKLSGAGGGGYLILASDCSVPGAMKIKIRRREDY